MKSVLITGTSKGFGHAMLNVFLQNSWHVYALARDITTISDVVTQHPELCHPIQGDITSDHVIESINEVVNKNTGKIDLLINNAGNAIKCFGIENVYSDYLDEHFKVHVSGTFRIIKTCLPFLRNSENPLIINISSRKGSINKINSGAYRILIPYQVAKAAQNMLTVCLNQELKDTNIKIYAIHPGNLKTDVAPPDADTEPQEAALEMYHWVTQNPDLPAGSFYSIMDKEVLDW